MSSSSGSSDDGVMVSFVLTPILTIFLFYIFVNWMDNGVAYALMKCAFFYAFNCYVSGSWYQNEEGVGWAFDQSGLGLALIFGLLCYFIIDPVMFNIFPEQTKLFRWIMYDNRGFFDRF